MKRWSTPWRRLPDLRAAQARTGKTIRRSKTRAAVWLTLVVLPAAACVTRGTHDEVVGALETDVARLEGEVRDLQRSNRSLDDERVRLIDEMEDLRQERSQLSRDVEKLAKTKALLTEHLREREEQVQELAKATSTYRELVDDLESEVSSGQIQIEQLREGIRLNLAQDILFRSGAAKLEGSGVAVLRKVSKQLREIEHTVEVQGHTDDVPLSPSLASRYGTNWELAAARAASVVRLFEEQGVDPKRLTVVSYGEHEPVASNDTPEGRAYNRRIDIRLIPKGSGNLPPAARRPGSGPDEGGEGSPGS